MRRLGFLLMLGLLAFAPARAQDSGIVSIEQARVPATMADPSRLPQTAFVPSARSDRLQGAAAGGWWRLHPAVSPDERLLLVYHPYSAQVTVLMPPDYRPQRQSMFDTGLDARYSRRALAFPLRDGGPIYIGVAGARYPLQVAVRDMASHAVSDRSHVRVLYTVLGVLIGVCLVALLFWASLRDRVYLLYAACMATQLLYLLCSYGEAYSLPGLRLLAQFGVQGVWFVATLSTIVAVYFLLDFADLRKRVPIPAKALILVGAWLPMLMLALLLSPWPANKDWFPNLGNGLLSLANVLAIACLTLAWRRGGRHAGLTLLAWVPLVVMSTARALQLGSGSPLPGWLEYGLPLTVAYAAVVLMLGLADRMLAFRRERDRAQHDAERDPLTGAYNRVAIEQRLQRAIAQAWREHQPVSVLFLDLDHFKRINDTHGHTIGDECLRQLAQLVGEETREHDAFGRLGGEEFLLVLPGENLRRARDTAERIRRVVERRRLRVAGQDIPLTVSIGVTECVRGDTAVSVIQRADEAMYAAKHGGRNRVATLAANP